MEIKFWINEFYERLKWNIRAYRKVKLANDDGRLDNFQGQLWGAVKTYIRVIRGLKSIKITQKDD